MQKLIDRIAERLGYAPMAICNAWQEEQARVVGMLVDAEQEKLRLLDKLAAANLSAKQKHNSTNKH